MKKCAAEENEDRLGHMLMTGLRKGGQRLSTGFGNMCS